MNQKGFIPIVILVIGVVVAASATLGVVKYKDEIVANISNVFISSNKIEVPNPDSTVGDEASEEPELVEEPIIEEVVEVPAITPPAEPAEPIELVEPEEEVEEAGEPEEISEPEEPEEELEEVEEVEILALTISDINVDVSRNPAVISWVTNKESSGVMEYGLAAGVYNSDSISGNIVISDNGFLHTVYLFVEDNTVYHYRVVSADLDGNRAESEDRTFEKEAYNVSPASLYPSSTPISFQSLSRPSSPTITSHEDGETLDYDDDDNDDIDGFQIELSGAADPDVTILIQVNDSDETTYETTADEDGEWEQRDITLQEGENTITVIASSNGQESEPTVITINVEEEYDDDRDDDGDD